MLVGFKRQVKVLEKRWDWRPGRSRNKVAVGEPVAGGSSECFKHELFKMFFFVFIYLF